MQEVNDLHQKAMVFADRAEEAKRNGNNEDYLKLTQEALQYESEAAWKVAGAISLEPSRSVLFRSAATLAVECSKFRIAEQLIAAALAGEPPEEIAEELRDLLEDVYFNRHLEVRGVTLLPGDMQMSLEGDAIGFGFARSDAFVQRVKDFETLLYRTTERRAGRKFREVGRRNKKLAESLELYLSVPRAASFAVTLRLGKNKQLELPGIDFTAETMKELLDGLEMVNEGNHKALEKSIPDESYRNNFIGLVERLAPDGDDVRTVGFTTAFRQDNRVVALATPKKKLRERVKEDLKDPQQEKKNDYVKIQGTLLEANAKKQKEGMIEVIDNTRTAHKITVPRGMMSDIVKPMFEEKVLVVGIRQGSKIVLKNIDFAEEDAE